MKDARPDAHDALLAEGFARQAESWARACGASASATRAVRQAAEAVSLATSNGHVCVSLHDLTAVDDGPVDAATWREALLASGVVGTPEAPGSFPLVLDGEDRLYLHRYFDYERRLAERLRSQSQVRDLAITSWSRPKKEKTYSRGIAEKTKSRAARPKPDRKLRREARPCPQIVQRDFGAKAPAC